MHQGVWSCLPNHRASAVPRAVTGAATEKTSSDTGPNAIGSPEADPVVTAVAPTPRPLSLSGNPVLRTDSLDYHLPPDLLATAPAAERSEARLLVACRNRSAPQHQSIANLHEHLRPGDLLVVNTSRVVQARLLGFRTDTGGKVQMLYLRGTGNQWQAFVRTKRVKAGMTVLIKAREGPAAGNATLIEPLDASAGEAGAWRIESDAPIESILERAGLPPLPPLARHRSMASMVLAGTLHVSACMGWCSMCSASMGLNVPLPTCSTTRSTPMPPSRSRSRAGSSRCRPAVGAATEPSWSAKTVW